MKYRILWSTRNSGMYVGDQIAPLETSKGIVRGKYPGRRLRWQQEGGDICSYLSAEDMSSEDKAVARLRPIATRASK